MHDERFETEPNEAIVGFLRNEERFINQVMAHINPDGFVFFA